LCDTDFSSGRLIKIGVADVLVIVATEQGERHAALAGRHDVLLEARNRGAKGSGSFAWRMGIKAQIMMPTEFSTEFTRELDVCLGDLFHRHAFMTDSRFSTRP